MHRSPVNKSRSAKQFNSRHSKTYRINLASPRRGGYRL